MKTHRWLSNGAGRQLAVTILMILGLPLLASATLGGSLDSVQQDQTRFSASRSVAAGQAYSVHVLTTPTNVVIREYVSTDGHVFAVSWRGPFIPDMRQLLGRYFQQYTLAASAAREGHVGRIPLNIRQPGLVVRTGGHMRAYFGRAYDPQLLPAEVSADDIR
jgi:hypothetical protein